MKTNVTYTEAGEVDSFIIHGERTHWYWHMNGNTAEWSRTEVDKDDHSTDDAVVLFGGEWHKARAVASNLPFVDEIAVKEPLDE